MKCKCKWKWTSRAFTAFDIAAETYRGGVETFISFISFVRQEPGINCCL
jgi:hypothetical protein